ncbi:MAG: ABC transporter ATP-binding protein [Nocardioidaceae bacterium]
MAEVKIVGVRKRFGRTEVVHGVDFTVADEEFVVLVGPSGCGKSTLLRMVAGLERITQGEVYIGDVRVNDLPPKQRGCAMVFQNYALYPHMKVYDNMAFSMALRRAPKKEIQERVRMAARTLEIDEYLDRYPKELSGGQRQRVAIGRALVRDPSVFLFDEPLSNLDAKLRVAMRAELKELQRRLNRTAIYVTHDQVEAMTMGDRIVVLHDGVVEQVGDPLTVYDHPSNTFVAGFIGSPAMNMFPATVRRADGGSVAVTDVGVTLPLPSDAPASDGKRIVYGVRPEHVRLAGADDGVPAEVGIVEPLGSQTAALVRFHEDAPELQMLSADRLDITPGDKVRIAPSPAHLHLFDEETGNRL